MSANRSVTIDPTELAPGEEVTFLPGGLDIADDPEGVSLLRTPGFYNVFNGDELLTITTADDGVTVESELGAGWFPHGVTLTHMGSRAAWREAQGY